LSTIKKPIELTEIVGPMSPSELAGLKQRVHAILKDSSYFGENRWRGLDHNENMEEMRRLHPGFSEDVYTRALMRGIFETR